jgi:hypothetical protein
VAPATRRLPLALVIAATALLAAITTLALDRGITALQTPAVTPTIAPTLQPVVVLLPTPIPEVQPSDVPPDETQALLADLQRRSSLQLAYTFVGKTQEQLTLALEALQSNDVGTADRELVQAKVSLDTAFSLLPEELRPQIDQERLELGRIRGDLVIDPRGLDNDLRDMRDRLLSVITLPAP